MRTAVMLLAIYLPVVAYTFEDQAEKKADKLEGVWLVKKAKSPEDPKLFPSGGYWKISMGKIALFRGNELDEYLEYKTKAGTPAMIDLVPDRGPEKGKTLKGIYELDGDNLKICYSPLDTTNPEKVTRPKKIGEAGAVTFILERKKARK